jgi:hypothetical protein
VTTSPEGNLVQLQAVLDLARRGATATADAMAAYIVWRTAEITLRRTVHAPGEWYNQKAGEPPAYASGNLAESMFYKPASSGLRASAMVGNKADYSRILEFGCVIVPVNKQFLHWTDSKGSWYHKFLEVPAHPFLSPTTEESIDDGSLQEVAIEAFMKYDP